MQKLIIFLTLWLWGYSAATAQYSPAPIFTVGSEIVLQKASDGLFYYHHKVAKGQTLYALSKTFGHSLQKLQTLNKKSNNQVSLGETVLIPIPQNYLFKGSSLTINDADVYLPVVYYTLPKDNMYRLSKVYFKQGMDMIMARNNMPSTSMDVNQRIVLGWYPVSSTNNDPITSTTTTRTTTTIQEAVPAANTIAKPIKTAIETSTTTTTSIVVPTTETTVTAETAVTQTEIITNESIEQVLMDSSTYNYNEALLGSTLMTSDMKLTEAKEVAYWDKNILNNGEVYVLHNTAKLDTYIELYNNITKRSVRAKVIGKIPFGAYTSDVKLIISPEAASALGALDQRLRVEMKYFQ